MANKDTMSWAWHKSGLSGKGVSPREFWAQRKEVMLCSPCLEGVRNEQTRSNKCLGISSEGNPDNQTWDLRRMLCSHSRSHTKRHLQAMFLNALWWLRPSQGIPTGWLATFAVGLLRTCEICPGPTWTSTSSKSYEELICGKRQGYDPRLKLNRAMPSGKQRLICSGLRSLLRWNTFHMSAFTATSSKTIVKPSVEKRLPKRCFLLRISRTMKPHYHHLRPETCCTIAHSASQTSDFWSQVVAPGRNMSKPWGGNQLVYNCLLFSFGDR